MATFTTNYNLRKPAGSEFVTVDTDLNSNFDTLDTVIKAVDDARISGDADLDTRTDALELVKRKIYIKTAAQNVNNSTTTVADNKFSFPVVAGNTYYFHGVLLLVSTSDTPDFRWQFDMTSGAGNITCVSIGSGTDSVGTVGALNVANNAKSRSSSFPTAVAGSGVTTTVTPLFVDAILECTTSGTLVFKWAQLAATAVNTTMEAGSFFTQEVIAA